MVQTGNKRSDKRKGFHSVHCLKLWVWWPHVSMHATLHDGMTLPTGGCDKKGSNGRLSTIPILNVFGRLERRSGEVEKGKKRDTERRQN